MKVGILSMQRIVNYGSLMQSLALKEMINSLGHDVVFVDYTIEPIVSERNNSKKRLITKVKNVKKNIKGMPVVKQILDIKRRIDNSNQIVNFEKCYPMLGMTAAMKYRTKVDTLVIGSDEVFNCLQSNPNVGYSLELFGKNNRAKRLISYAASFGSTTEEELNKYGVKDEIASYLKKFDNISIRDKNSEKIIKSLCGFKPVSHLDPVLVGDLENRKWRETDEKNYIIVYGYINRFTEEEGRIIKSFAKERNLKIIAMGGSQEFADKTVWCRPDEVLSYIKGADFIVTDTFHGSIFSIICHKQFATFCRKKGNVKNNQASNEEKLTDMLQKMTLTDRIVGEDNDIEKILLKPIDYNNVDEIRKHERERSIDYLKNNIK